MSGILGDNPYNDTKPELTQHVPPWQRVPWLHGPPPVPLKDRGGPPRKPLLLRYMTC